MLFVSAAIVICGDSFICVMDIGSKEIELAHIRDFCLWQQEELLLAVSLAAKRCLGHMQSKCLVAVLDFLCLISKLEMHPLFEKLLCNDGLSWRLFFC